MSFFRLVRQAAAQKDERKVAWRDRLLAVEYEDQIIEADRFTDDASILYACAMDADGGFTVLKDSAGLIEKMGHTFAGWPISSPVGKVTELDPRAPRETKESDTEERVR